MTFALAHPGGQKQVKEACSVQGAAGRPRLPALIPGCRAEQLYDLADLVEKSRSVHSPFLVNVYYILHRVCGNAPSDAPFKKCRIRTSCSAFHFSRVALRVHFSTENNGTVLPLPCTLSASFACASRPWRP